MSNLVSEQKKETKKKSIMDAAFSLFANNGFSNVKVSDIAEKAGIGKGTVYEYFKSKDDILVKFLEYIKAELLQLGDTINRLPDFKAKLTTLITFEFEFLKRYGPHAPEIKQSTLGMDMRISDDLKESIGEIVAIEYNNIAAIVNFGIQSGDIKECSIPTAVHFITTNIASFAALSTIAPACSFYKHIDGDYVRQYTPEEIYELLMNGLRS